MDATEGSDVWFPSLEGGSVSWTRYLCVWYLTSHLAAHENTPPPPKKKTKKQKTKKHIKRKHKKTKKKHQKNTQQQQASFLC